ncbi:UPF0598 protein C8orf82 homolog isoform X2 [Chelmon rostratus]|uniref:UPF0598 protein C8orf82 homolog isoform X2 n=1 Tax=Chelmon rostratus TaxID=109905 RepID=UPI001BEA9404|nr:UPF0598 protein C8orf82 homolog isoform X2 [Chelmon rostratus]
MLFLRTAALRWRGLAALRCVPSGFTTSRTTVTYIQGQSPEPRIREYFYYIDHQGQLFLDDTKVKNFVTCFKVGCGQIKVVVTRRTSPTCPCVAGRGTSCAAMIVLWSSPTCCRVPQRRRESWEIRSCCRTAAGRKSCPSRSALKRCTCILSLDEFTTPAQSAEGGSAWSGRLWPSSSAHSLCTLRGTANQLSLHTFSGEDRSTH